MDPWNRVAQLSLFRVQDGTPLIFETAAPTAITEVENLVERIRYLARDKNGANPVIITGTEKAGYAKKTWWIPTFTITHWNEPNVTVLPAEPVPEPQQMPAIEKPAPAAEPQPEGAVEPRSNCICRGRCRRHLRLLAGDAPGAGSKGPARGLRAAA
jgi:hypothetical protein